MKKYLQLVRFPNLLMIIATQLVIKYCFFEPFAVEITLNGFGYSLLIIATVCLAAAGNIINDIYDVQADSINKPNRVIIGKHLSEKKAYNLFIGLNVIGVLLGFYLSNMIGRPIFSGIFIMVSGILYLYATSLKSYLVVGNIIISVLVALVIILPALYDLLPVITPQNQATQRTFFSIILDYAIFAFLINWLREMVKDQQDIQGDHKAGINTLPISLGQERTNKLIFIISILPLVAILYYIYAYLYNNMYALAYAVLFVLAPLLWFMFKIISTKHKKEFSTLNGLLKLILIFGIISIALYPFLWK